MQIEYLKFNWQKLMNMSFFIYLSSFRWWRRRCGGSIDPVKRLVGAQFVQRFAHHRLRQGTALPGSGLLEGVFQVYNPAGSGVI